MLPHCCLLSLIRMCSPCSPGHARSLASTISACLLVLLAIMHPCGEDCSRMFSSLRGLNRHCLNCQLYNTRHMGLMESLSAPVHLPEKCLRSSGEVSCWFLQSFSVTIHFSISIFFSEVLICITDTYSYFFPRMFPTASPLYSYFLFCLGPSMIRSYFLFQPWSVHDTFLFPFPTLVHAQ